MKPESNHVYTIKDDFFEEFPDPNLKFNKGGRPHYYAFKGDKNDRLIWMIPMSTKTEKLENTINKREEMGKPTDFGHVCMIGNKKSAFLIGDMFPVTKDYIQDEFRQGGQPLKVTRRKDIEAIEQKASRIHNLIRKGKKFTPYQVDAKGIEEKLINKIEKDYQRKLRMQQFRNKRER